MLSVVYVVYARYYEGGDRMVVTITPTAKKAEEAIAILRKKDTREVERWYEEITTFGF